ncbi:MAG: VOC family protein [Ignavibacteria bacterium]|nr:VOC family protein [Ignavibacteria bacterium]
MKFKLKQYIYFVKDMALMRNFYVNILGLNIIKNKTYSEDEWLELGGGGFKICLHYSSVPGLQGKNKNKLVFSVDDLGKARDYLIGHKVKMGKHHVWNEIEACDGFDPEGNKFQIASKR